LCSQTLNVYGLRSEKGQYESFLRTIEQNGAALGAYAIFLANRREWVRQSCGAEIELSDQSGGSGVQAILRTESCAADKTLTFVPDKIDCATADRFGRSMAPPFALIHRRMSCPASSGCSI